MAATGEVYFNYGDKISSKRVAEAIAMPYGVGPICGFGSAAINGNQLLVKPYALGDENGTGSNNFTDPARYLVRDLIRNHHIPRAEDADVSDYRITFGVVAKDGILYRSGSDSLTVNIEGNKGTYNQVLLFAEHRHVSEPVQNLVSFRAFWNESNFDFFNLYKKSLDIYYPSTEEARKASIADKYDPSLNEEMSYDYLINKVGSACPTYDSNQKTLVLIGIYGDGTNQTPEKEQVEKFAIVPYGGQFPVSIRYNSAIHSYFKEALSRMESFLSYDRINSAVDLQTGTPLTFTNLIDYLEWLIDTKTAKLQNQIQLLAIPIGTIVLYDGEEIPRGWEVYDKAAGRVVIGYTAGGIQLNTTADGSQTVLQNLGDTYDPLRADDRWHITIEGKDLPKHFHGLGIKAGRQDNVDDAYSTCLCNFNDRSTDINGTMWDSKYNPVSGIIKGAVLSGANIISSNPNDEATKEKLVFSKLPSAITLRYIKKTASAENVNEGA